MLNDICYSFCITAIGCQDISPRRHFTSGHLTLVHFPPWRFHSTEISPRIEKSFNGRSLFSAHIYIMEVKFVTQSGVFSYVYLPIVRTILNLKVAVNATGIVRFLKTYEI